jgi:hypothetical protein
MVNPTFDFIVISIEIRSRNMIFQQWTIVAVLVLGLTSLVLLLTQNWRVYILTLAVQYLCVFWLVTLSWSLGLAAVKLIAGWMAGAILASSHLANDIYYLPRAGLPGTLLRFFTAVMVILIVYSIAPGLSNWLPASPNLLWGGLILICMGVLQLGMTTRPLRVVVGLLTMLSGFEVLYAVVESSVLVAGLLAVVNIGLAVVGAYLLMMNERQRLS